MWVCVAQWGWDFGTAHLADGQDKLETFPKMVHNILNESFELLAMIEIIHREQNMLLGHSFRKKTFVCVGALEP